MELTEEEFAGCILIGVHVECAGRLGFAPVVFEGRLGEGCKDVLVPGREEGGRGDGDGFVAGREHGPTVGATFRDVEFLAWAQELQDGQVVDAATAAVGEAETGSP